MSRSTDGDRDRLDRLATSGSADERALLQAAPAPIIPEPVRARILQQLERRLSLPQSSRVRGRLAVGLGVLLVAGSAAAYGVARLTAGPQRDRVLAPPPVPADTTPATRPPPPVPPISPPPAPPARPRRRVAAAASPPPVPPATPTPQQTAPAVIEPSPPAAALVIRGVGRGEVSLALAGDRLVGRSGATAIDLHLSDGMLTGRLGAHPVSLAIHDRRAEGTVGGRPIRFELADIPEGKALRAVSVGLQPLFAANGLLEVTPTRLWWRSLCTGALTARAVGEYQGTCGADGLVSAILPPAWWQLPPLPRMIVLALLVTSS